MAGQAQAAPHLASSLLHGTQTGARSAQSSKDARAAASVTSRSGQRADRFLAMNTATTQASTVALHVKKADAAFRISFALRGFRFSRSSSSMRSASAELTPGRGLPSISAWRTHLRSLSLVIPELARDRGDRRPLRLVVALMLDTTRSARSPG